MASRPLARTLSPKAFHLTGRKVLAIALAGFGLVLAINGAFVWLALDGFSGLSRPNAYREGLHYNDELAAAAEQRARGWQSRYTLEAGRLVLAVALPDGTPVTGLALTAAVGRPATDDYDQTLALTETQPGRYLAAVTLAPGQWSVVATGADAEGRAYRSEARLWR
jgi:nitrogen fixation protein FixH